MGGLSIYHWLIVLLVGILLFGGRKIPDLMRGIGEGIRLFRERSNRTSEQTDKGGPNSDR
jgi:sec-independent protein translocase protein TatA